MARETVEIDVAGIRKYLDSLPSPDNCYNKKIWSDKEDAILKEYWPIRKHADVARALGVSKDTALARYRELKGNT